MAKTNHKETEDEVIVDIGGTYNTVELWIEKNKNTLIYALLPVIVLIGGYFAYNSLYLAPLQVEAEGQIWKAQQYFAQDSLELAQFGDGNYMGFEDIADEYSGTKAGNLSNYYLGLIAINKGEFEEAIDYLGSFSSDDIVLSAVALGAMGDASMELDDPDAALNYYVKAARKNANDFTTPVYLMKAAKVAEALGDYGVAVKHYEEIQKKFGETQEGRQVEKYLARAKTLASK